MCRQCQWSCPSEFWSIFLVAKWVSFYLLACGNEISNWKNWCFFFRNIDPHNSRLNKKRIVISKKNVRLGCNLPNLKVNGIYGMDSCIILIFRINFYNWSYSKISVEKLQLGWLVPIFHEKNLCPKQTQRKQNQNKGNEVKTVENIKYDPILGQFEMCENSTRWTKFDPLTINIFWIYNFSSMEIIKLAADFQKS